MKPPSPSQVPGLLEAVADDTRHALADLDLYGRRRRPRIVFAIELASESTYGPASANLDPTTSGSGSDVTLTPTESAAARRQGRELRDELLRAVADLEAASRRLRTMVAEYTGPAEAQAARSTRPITDTDEVCELHALVGAYEPIDRIGTAGGNLARAMRLCKACDHRIRRTGGQPSKTELGHHARSGKWPPLRSLGRAS